MFANDHKRKASAGTVQLKPSNGRLQLVFTHAGRRHYLSLGLTDTPMNRKAATAKAKLIEGDIVFERFDPTLEKYKAHSSLSIVTPTITPIESEIALAQLWERYIDYKSTTASPKTIKGTYACVTTHLGRCKTDGLVDAPLFRMELLQVTSLGMARKTLMHLSAAVKWGMRQGLVKSNPLDGMYTEILAPTPQSPKAFTPEQRDSIIQGFQESRDYHHYYPFVAFLLLTGCRPCEAVGLRWGNITLDCSRVFFCESIVELNGRLIRRPTTKTGIKRWFNCTPRLQAILLQANRPTNSGADDLVFPAPRGGAIGATNFTDRDWTKILSQLGLLELDGVRMTLYSCRDTFITLQISAGISSDIVSKWVGNSAAVIEKRYLDKLALENLRPAEI
jgi:integrase